MTGLGVFVTRKSKLPLGQRSYRSGGETFFCSPLVLVWSSAFYRDLLANFLRILLIKSHIIEWGLGLELILPPPSGTILFRVWER